MSTCILDPAKTCDDCGKCERCDLDESKICDNCCRCLGDSDYRGVEITEIIMDKPVKLKRKKKSSPPK